MATVIPKDCLLCDVCNAQLSDGEFIALADCTWYQGWLYCKPCETQYNPKKFLEHIRDILEGDDLSDSELALPIVIS